jgi:hypothetical protein
VKIISSVVQLLYGLIALVCPLNGHTTDSHHPIADTVQNQKVTYPVTFGVGYWPLKTTYQCSVDAAKYKKFDTLSLNEQKQLIDDHKKIEFNDLFTQSQTASYKMLLYTGIGILGFCALNRLCGKGASYCYEHLKENPYIEKIKQYAPRPNPILVEAVGSLVICCPIVYKTGMEAVALRSRYYGDHAQTIRTINQHEASVTIAPTIGINKNGVTFGVSFTV